jgi:hypothetical protein
MRGETDSSNVMLGTQEWRWGHGGGGSGRNGSQHAAKRSRRRWVGLGGDYTAADAPALRVPQQPPHLLVRWRLLYLGPRQVKDGVLVRAPAHQRPRLTVLLLRGVSVSCQSDRRRLRVDWDWSQWTTTALVCARRAAGLGWVGW